MALIKEKAILYACMRGTPILPQMFTGINGHSLVEIARQNQLAGLLYYELKINSLLKYVPAEQNNILQNIYFGQLEKGVRLQQEYAEISGRLQNAGVSFVPLKGIDWLSSIYGQNPGLRRMNDIDILISPSARKQTEKVFLDLGYTLYPANTYHDHHDMYAKQKFIVDAHFKINVDIVLELFEEFKIDVSEIQTPHKTPPKSPEGGLSSEFLNCSTEQIEIIKQVCGKQLAALNYWLNKEKPAIRLCDYMRLKSENLKPKSRELKWLLNITDAAILDAEKGNYDAVFRTTAGYNFFWFKFIAKALCYRLVENPKGFLRLLVAVVKWQGKRVRDKNLYLNRL